MNLACSPCNQDHEKRKKMKILDKKSKHWMNTGNKHDYITSIGVVSLMKFFLCTNYPVLSTTTKKKRKHTCSKETLFFVKQ